MQRTRCPWMSRKTRVSLFFLSSRSLDQNQNLHQAAPSQPSKTPFPPPRSLSGSPKRRHLTRRLVQAGVTEFFSVPGDFDLTLLDHLIAEPELTNIGCCSELNAGYARSRGIGAVVVTFTVSGLSVLNAIAGAYSENLPVICIVGGPNDFGTNRILHHTTREKNWLQRLPHSVLASL